MNQQKKTTLDPKEAKRFNQYADEWWNENGKFKILHQINPIRLEYIKEHVTSHLNIKNGNKTPFKGLKILDIGCGGGIVCEPMTRLGAQVTGVDVVEKNIEVAKKHAKETKLNIKYEKNTVEEFAKKKQLFDVIIAMEVIEHTANQSLFVETCCDMLAPNGLFFASTINRTLKALAFAIIGAEYILKWIPKGTHQWEKFLTPKEFSLMLKKNNTRIKDISGMVYNPIRQKFNLSKNTDINYFITAQKNINCR